MYKLILKLTLLTYLLVNFLPGSQVLAQKSKKKKQNRSDQSVIQPSQAEIESLLIEGMKYFILEDYEEALSYFQKAKDISPEQASIHYKIAETYARTGNFSQAELYAKKAYELDQENLYYYLLLAKVYAEQQKYDEALRAYQLLIDSEVGSEEYYYEMANIYLKQKDYEKAIDSYNQVEKSYGISESVILRKQQIYLSLNQIEEAIKEGEKLVQADPDEPRHLISLSELLIANGQHSEALEILTEAQATQSFDPRVYLLLARIYQTEGDETKSMEQLQIAFANAELPAEEKIDLVIGYMQDSEASGPDQKLAKLVETVIQTHPYNARAHTLYGDILIMSSKREQALENYVRATELDGSTEVKVWQQILRLATEQKKNEMVLKYAEKALELYPNQASFWFYNAVGFLSQKQYDEALVACDEGRRLAFNDPELLLQFQVLQGDAYHGLGDYGKSDAAYEKALEQQPDLAEALNNYSYNLALRKEKLDKAKKMAARLVQKHPENASFLDTYGWVLYQSKDYKKSLELLEKATQNSSSGTILEHYGDVLFKLGETEKALEQWKKAREQGGVSDLIDKKIANKNLYE